MNSDANRIVFLDWLRAIAIFMVLLIHACEPFYLDAEGTAIASKFDAVWVTIILRVSPLPGSPRDWRLPKAAS